MEETPPSVTPSKEAAWFSRSYHLLLFAGLIGTVAVGHQAAFVFSIRNSVLGALSQSQLLMVIASILLGLAISCFAVAKILQVKGKLPLITKIISIVLVVAGITLPLLPPAYVNDPASGISTIAKGKNPEAYLGETEEIFEAVFGGPNQITWTDDEENRRLIYEDMTVIVKDDRIDQIIKTK